MVFFFKTSNSSDVQLYNSHIEELFKTEFNSTHIDLKWANDIDSMIFLQKFYHFRNLIEFRLEFRNNHAYIMGTVASKKRHAIHYHNGSISFLLLQTVTVG